jgi:dipeptidyl aminopeptidase/acylaminoacyl peptidase
VFIEDRWAYQFVDPKMAAVYRGLNKYLGDTCNLRIFDISDDGNRFLAWAQGPREPGTIYFYDRLTKRFDGVGQAAPQLAPERLATMETLAVKTRDGLPVTAYLSVPLASGPRPLVVLPHGGPETRDTYGYDVWAQVYAAQGWLVLQPNFRGSGGYGKAFADAGRKHWGDKMQEDVEDAIAQVVASGRADPKRIAICGGSYGGYAALMGAVRRPDLYKAVVSLAGVSDLMESISATRIDDGADAPSYFYWLETIGDPDKDRAMMQAASPALHADQISAPVLLIHGVEDTIVPVKQSRIMNSALKSAGKSVELIELRGAHHRDLQPEEWALIYKKSVAHIAKAFA